MYRCIQCGGCEIDPKFSEQQLHDHYQLTYFRRHDWELRKSRLLAHDYLKKIRCQGFRALQSMTCLEIGSGYGHSAQLVAPSVSIYDAIEPSADCRNYIGAQRVPIQTMARTVDELPANRSYDVIFAFHVVEHFQRMSEFLATIRSKLKPGGHAWFITPNGASGTFVRYMAKWGWACPEQHFQFASHTIPGEYYEKFHLKPSVVRDLQPHPVHYPSRVHAALLSQSEAESHYGLINSIKKAISRLFLQNSRRSLVVLRLEKWIASLLPTRPFDELLVCLTRTSDSKTL